MSLWHTRAHSHIENYHNNAKIMICQQTGQDIAFIWFSYQVRGNGGLSDPENNKCVINNGWLTGIYFFKLCMCVHIFTEVVCSCICGVWKPLVCRDNIPIGRDRKVGSSQNVCQGEMDSERSALMPTVGVGVQQRLRIPRFLFIISWAAYSKKSAVASILSLSSFRPH